jgi:hypothetical protein
MRRLWWLSVERGPRVVEVGAAGVARQSNELYCLGVGGGDRLPGSAGSWDRIGRSGCWHRRHARAIFLVGIVIERFAINGKRENLNSAMHRKTAATELSTVPVS